LLAYPEYARAVGLLRDEQLLRAHGNRRMDSAEPYHDRIREVVLSRLSPNERQQRHLALATALEGSDFADPETLAMQWHGAGHQAKAATYAIQAANDADTALAFDRAARLFQWVLELLPSPEPATRQDILIRLARALTHAGRFGDAAARYLEAAQTAGKSEAIELRRLATERYFHCGRFQEGTALLDGMLQDVGMPRPKSAVGMAAAFAWERARVSLRGLNWKQRPVTEISPETLHRADVAWVAMTGWAMLEPLLGGIYGGRYLRLSLDAGEPGRIGRALGYEATFRGTVGGTESPDAQRLLDEAMSIAVGLGDKSLEAVTLIHRASCQYLQGKPLRPSVDMQLVAEKILLVHGHGKLGEINGGRLFANNALYHLGEWKELSRRTRQHLREARTREDMSASHHNVSGVQNAVWLFEDDVEGARSELERGSQGLPTKGFSVPHYYQFLARVQQAIYAQDHLEALELFQRAWRKLRFNFMTRVPIVRFLNQDVRGRVFLLLARNDRAERKNALAQVRAAASAQANSGVVWAKASQGLLLAQVCWMEGNTQKAVEHFRAAELLFTQLEMRAQAEVARHRLGLLLGGEEGRLLQVAADRFFSQEGVVNVPKMMSMLAPYAGSAEKLLGPV
jgi:tetratricopeptide (TPR) repeat protein